MAGATALAAGLSAGGSIYGNIHTNNVSSQRDREARQWAERQQERANVYNSPAMMMQRLRHAGLNPNLMSGQPPAEASSVAPPGVSQPQYSNPFQNLPADINSYNLSQAQARLLNAQAEGIETDNSYKDQDWFLTLGLKGESLQAAKDLNTMNRIQSDIVSAITKNPEYSEFILNASASKLNSLDLDAKSQEAISAANYSYNSFVSELNKILYDSDLSISYINGKNFFGLTEQQTRSLKDSLKTAHLQSNSRAILYAPAILSNNMQLSNDEVSRSGLSLEVLQIAKHMSEMDDSLKKDLFEFFKRNPNLYKFIAAGQSVLSSAVDVASVAVKFVK